MKAMILAGAVVAGVFAAAQTAQACPNKTGSQQSSLSSPERKLDAVAQADQSQEAPQYGQDQQGLGVSTDERMGTSSTNDMGIGGSGNEGVQENCPPATSGTGGSGAYENPDTMSSTPTEAPPPSEPALAPPPAEPSTTAAPYTASAEPVQHKESHADMRGVTVTAGAGIEGYSFGLAPEISPGPAWGVNLDLRPTRVLGLELGYSGATNELRGSIGTSGADLIRNGGQAVATLGLTAAPVQPYVLGGIGISHYNARAGALEGFRDDTSGSVPVGAGLRTHMGHLTADARFGYSFLFDQELKTTGVATNSVSDPGRYTGTVSLGTTF